MMTKEEFETFLKYEGKFHKRCLEVCAILAKHFPEDDWAHVNEFVVCGGDVKCSGADRNFNYWEWFSVNYLTMTDDELEKEIEKL